MKKLLTVCLIIALAVPALVFAQGSGEAKSQEIVLKWPSFWVGADTKAAPITELVNQFNEAHAGSIKVEIEENPDTDGYRDKLNAQIAAGIVPDIFILNVDPTTLQFFEGDLLMDFTEDLKGDWGNGFLDGTLNAVTVDKQTKAIPYEMAYTPIWYNTAILKAAGVDKIPETMDEFWAMCDAVKAAGYIPTVQMTGGTNAWTSMIWYSHLCAALGGPDVWQKDFATDPVFVQAAELLNRMYQDGNTSKDAIGAGPGDAGGHYLAGEAAAFSNGPWYIARVKNEAPAVYDATEIATAPGINYSGAQTGYLLSALAAANTTDPARRAAVVEFMKWMTTGENAKTVSEAAGSILAVKADITSTDKIQTQFFQEVADASFVVETFSAKFPVDVVAEFGQALAKMAQGKATPEQFVAQIASVM
ncbi:MAG: ABC transporter substrate-binding protein [Sphaerochaetaceae bacterium]|nr:ABC transporter substrate-binding protein [Sphaerochaetaceae bacterium]MDD3163216.1 ABC transporter substrate-binding protein [Sphaerochaetaceae bacterium]MDD4007627.1 ABC transporter substrate-binding protein [Sphaerochaetaceae bacterium]